MVARWLYDALYRRGAPWEGGPRSELVGLVEAGRLDPGDRPRAIDLGCGSGANAIHLAQQGFAVTGVDFSPVALAKARAAAIDAGVVDRCSFVEADLTADLVASGVLQGGSMDLVVDYGTLDDLRGERRLAMARLVHDLTRPGSVFLLWCFHAPRAELPWFSTRGPSRLFPGLLPGEESELFGAAFAIERLAEPAPGSGAACFLMTRMH